MNVDKLAVGQNFHLVLFSPPKHCFTNIPYSCMTACGVWIPDIMLQISTWASFLDHSLPVFNSQNVRVNFNISFMKQQFVLTHQYTILQETEKPWQILYSPTYKHVMFLWKYTEKQLFCGYSILRKDVFLTQVSSNVGILFWWIMWVATNYCFTRNLWTSHVCVVRLQSCGYNNIYVTL
jgi:hypothetical protein